MNSIAEYTVPTHIKREYETEIETWIQNRWLRPYDEVRYGTAKGLIPLMVVIQKNKGKVRPVMDFRELNSYVEAYTASADVCADKLREWRRQGTNVSVIDLRRAYLQIHVHESLWPFQTVKFRGKRYCLTRLGFGLNVAPIIMKSVLSMVLAQDKKVQQASSPYIDDIYINEDITSVHHVQEHLARYGLECKPAERLSNGAKVLGLEVWGEEGTLKWKRGSKLDDIPKTLTRRTVFSFCGKLVGHLPVCGWLRVASSYIKRKVNAITSTWDEEVFDEKLLSMMEDVALKVKQDDPARGKWNLSGEEATVWADASSLALGVMVQVDGHTIEDASWIRSEDASHINMAELDALIKGVNMALQWKMKRLHLKTDSSTVYRWVSDALTGKARLKSKAASEMLIRRRISLLKALVDEYSLDVEVELVASEFNLADSLTRVPQRWLKSVECLHPTSVVCATAVDSTLEDQISSIHGATGHQGIRRTLYFVRRAHLIAIRLLFNKL